MNIYFSAEKLETLDYSAIIKTLLAENRKAAESLIKNEGVVEYFLKLLEYSDIQANSFISQESLLELSKSESVEEIVFYDAGEGLAYEYLYKYLRENGSRKAVIVDKKPTIFTTIPTSRALDLLLGGFKNSEEREPVLRKPVFLPKEERASQYSEILYRVRDGKMVLMIPRGIKARRVICEGVEFDVFVAEAPDTSYPSLQALDILPPVPDTPTEDAPTEDKELSTLKEQKSELDKKIVEVRALGNHEVLKALRKERRRLRNKIRSIEEKRKS